MYVICGPEELDFTSKDRNVNDITRLCSVVFVCSVLEENVVK